MLAGCHEPQMQRCVDEHNHVVDDSFLQGSETAAEQLDRITHLPYHYYYGGSGSYIPEPIATGGSYTPVSGVSYATSRGGFGTSFGGGEGEEAVMVRRRSRRIMQRISLTPRDDWQSKVESAGLTFHSPEEWLALLG